MSNITRALGYSAERLLGRHLVVENSLALVALVFYHSYASVGVLNTHSQILVYTVVV
jgi:hypothetical protein